jgi:short-subunit dehydrogenase
VQLTAAHCLVTGASGGIGRAVAVELTRRRAKLLLTGRDEAALAEVARATGGRPLPADLTAPQAVEALAENAGDVDVVVHAAGIGQFGRALDVSRNELERLVAVNVTAPLALTTALLPGMLERRRGYVVFVGSIVGRLGRKHETVYAATKAAVSIYADSLRAELRGTGVGVLLVTPGPVATTFFERRGTPYDRDRPRPVPPERVAAATIHGLERGRGEVTVPGWLSLPVRLRGAAPAAFDAAAARFD